MKKRKRILAITPNALDATSFYRSRGIIPSLMDELEDVEFFESDRLNWDIALRCDAVFIQRPYSAEHLQAVEIALNSNLRVWVDFDDDLFSVPRGNPAFKHYSQEQVKKNIALITAKADLVTVSTEQLKRKFLALNKETHVVPNALNDRLINARPTPNKERNAVIMWRGSATHDRDVATHLQAIKTVAERNPKWFFVFLGDVFWQVSDVLPQRQYLIMPPIDPVVYWHEIGKLQPLIQIVPLEDNEFNRSKSNIAWIEGTWSHAACLVPDWEEWKNPGSIRYSSRDDFQRSLQGMIEASESIPHLVEESWGKICKDLLLSEVSKRRATLVRKMLESPKLFGSWLPLKGQVQGSDLLK